MANDDTSSISGSTPALGRLATVQQMTRMAKYGWITPSALRHLIFQSKSRLASNGEIIQGNGLGRAIIRVGRKVLIDLDEFDAWLDEHRESVDGA